VSATLDLDVITPPALCCAPIAAPGITAGEAQDAAEVFKALADPNRVRIVNLLANSGGAVCVCDITSEVGLSQGTVSFHLKKLLQTGLLRREPRGTWAFYSLDHRAMERLAGVFGPAGHDERGRSTG
jgi:ArsR family transcriptional regulator